MYSKSPRQNLTDLHDHRKAKKIKKKSKVKIVDPDKATTFFDPENIPKLKKIGEKLDELKIPKKWE